jgi:hypothetical protein
MVTGNLEEKLYTFEIAELDFPDISIECWAMLCHILIGMKGKFYVSSYKSFLREKLILYRRNKYY